MLLSTNSVLMGNNNTALPGFAFRLDVAITDLSSADDKKYDLHVWSLVGNRPDGGATHDHLTSGHVAVKLSE